MSNRAFPATVVILVASLSLVGCSKGDGGGPDEPTPNTVRTSVPTGPGGIEDEPDKKAPRDDRGGTIDPTPTPKDSAAVVESTDDLGRADVAGDEVSIPLVVSLDDAEPDPSGDALCPTSATGWVKNVCVPPKGKAWPSTRDSLFAGAVAVQFVDEIWTISAENPPEKALNKALTRWATDGFKKKALKTSGTGDAYGWENIADAGGRFTGPGPDVDYASPSTEHKHSKDSLVFTVVFDVTYEAERLGIHTGSYFGDYYFMNVRVTRGADGVWKVADLPDLGKSFELPGTIIG